MPPAAEIVRRLLACLLLAVSWPQPSAAGPTDSTGFPTRPFAKSSVWNRRVPSSATFADVQDAIFGDASGAPSHAGLDLVTLCTTNESAPLVRIERGNGWTYPDRSLSSGQLLYERRLDDDACTDVAWNRVGNGLFVLLDPSTGLADLGVGAWRNPGGPLLNSASDGSGAHGLDVHGGNGIDGYGRASGLPALGGLIRQGELGRAIRHALAINVNVLRLSADRHFVWPAASADGSAPVTYQGGNPDYAMGTLLAIPRSVKVNRYEWRTPQGYRMARNAQKYGWYIVDGILGGSQVQFGIETGAARNDLGLAIDATSGAWSVDPAKFDPVAFDEDIVQILHLLQAVTSNGP